MDAVSFSEFPTTLKYTYMYVYIYIVVPEGERAFEGASSLEGALPAVLVSLKHSRLLEVVGKRQDGLVGRQ